MCIYTKKTIFPFPLNSPSDYFSFSGKTLPHPFLILKPVSHSITITSNTITFFTFCLYTHTILYKEKYENSRWLKQGFFYLKLDFSCVFFFFSFVLGKHTRLEI